MSTYNTNKGRSLEQQTHDGTSSIGTMGAGCTGHRNLSGASTPSNQQSAGRTDDLLSGGVEEEECDHGFQVGQQYQQGGVQQGPAKPPRGKDR